MGRRCQPRKQVEVQVRMFGTDSDSHIFSETLRSVNISGNGAEVAGVNFALSLDDIVGLNYGKNWSHFRVKWIGEAERSNGGCVGFLNVAPAKQLWDFPLPADAADEYQLGSVEGRKTPRYRCQNSVEIHVADGVTFWGSVADLSLGGCYVEIPIPLELGKKLRIGIWFGQTKAWANARITHSTPGLGIGLKFTDISESDLDQIRKFVDRLTPLAAKPMRPVDPSGTKM